MPQWAQKYYSTSAAVLKCRFPSISRLDRAHFIHTPSINKPLLAMEDIQTEYKSWSPDKLVDRVMVLEQQLKELNEKY